MEGHAIMRKMLRGYFIFSSAVVLLLVLAGPAFSQRTTGTLRGQGVDPTGGVVANAKVTATNEETAVSVESSTTSAGTYDFPSVLPGKYKVAVEVSGFKKFVKSGVVVLADQDNVADA